MRINKLLKNNRTLLNGGLFSIYSFVNEGIAFVLLILLANFIAPAEYGKLSMFNTLVQFMGYFVALSSQAYISVSYFKRGAEKFRVDFSTIFFISIIATAFFCLLAMFGGNWIAKQSNLSSVFIWFAIVVSFFKLHQGIWLDYYRIKEEIGKYGIVSCGFALLNLIFSLYLVIKTPLNWEGRVYAQLVCTSLFGIFAVLYFGKQNLFTLQVSWANAKTIIIYGLPLIPHLASLWIKQGGDRFIINHYHSIEDVGLFSFALNLTSIIIIIGTAFNNTNSVTIYKVLSGEQDSETKTKELKKQTRIISLITLVASFVIILGVVAFVPLLLPKYNASLPYFLILSIQGIGQCFYFLYCNYLFYYMKTKHLMYVTFSTSLLHLGLSILLTRYSLYMTCLIYVFTQLIVTGIIYLISKKIINENLIVNESR